MLPVQNYFKGFSCKFLILCHSFRFMEVYVFNGFGYLEQKHQVVTDFPAIISTVINIHAINCV
ncbi:unnamed protein product [Larinioides sclopetarius]|uniref:Uncharacterized protein n=1 Tax=Larinioides sclopetarius TaxID=280406 RepID=A0AAV2AIF7_9ARAC